jgi:hypothetical protein
MEEKLPHFVGSISNLLPKTKRGASSSDFGRPKKKFKGSGKNGDVNIQEIFQIRMERNQFHIQSSLNSWLLFNGT